MNELEAISELNESLKELSKYAKAFSDLVSIMAELSKGQSRQQEFFEKFNEFIWYMNQKCGTDFRMFQVGEYACESICYFNNVVNYINGKYDKKIQYAYLGIGWDEAFFILDSMKEAIKEVNGK